jgi:hypothetical protein
MHRSELWTRIKVPGAPSCWDVFWRRIAGFVSVLTLKGWLVAPATGWSSFRTARDCHGVSLITVAFARPIRPPPGPDPNGRPRTARLGPHRYGRPALAPKSPKPPNAPPAPQRLAFFYREEHDDAPIGLRLHRP